MNRRNFFSLAALSFGALLARRVSAILPTPTALPAASQLEAAAKRDLNAWAEKYRHLLPSHGSLGDNGSGFGPAAHSHSISDPGHSHSVNPNWVYHNWPRAPHG